MDVHSQILCPHHPKNSTCGCIGLGSVMFSDIHVDSCNVHPKIPELLSSLQILRLSVEDHILLSCIVLYPFYKVTFKSVWFFWK